MPVALITGLSGQDGSYLADLLVADGYEVHGLVRDRGLGAASHLEGTVIAHAGDLRDADSLRSAVRGSRPDEVFHMGAVTHVASSDLDPDGVRDVVAGGTRRLLEAVVAEAPDARVFCASSAEMFGSPESAPQDETTEIRPRNAYGEAKAEAFEIARAFRDSLWVSVGILYNHESPRRPLDFVTRKVTWHAAAIAAGKATELRIGSLSARRDWGAAHEYMDGARRTLRAAAPDDFVFATGVLHSVGELVDIAFERVGVPVDGHVVVDPAFTRADEAVPLLGNAAKASRLLGWQASVQFEEVVREMVDADVELLSG